MVVSLSDTFRSWLVSGCDPRIDEGFQRSESRLASSLNLYGKGRIRPSGVNFNFKSRVFHSGQRAGPEWLRSGDWVMTAQELAQTEEQGLPLPTAEMGGDDL